MYKRMALVAALAAGLGYGSDKMEWIKTGGKAVELASRSGDWKSVLPDLYELAGGKGGQNDKGARKSAVKKSYGGRITRISDGDTIHVTDSDGQKHKIRMAHIDAPELNQAYGTRSRDNLADKAGYAKVRVKVFGLDRYGREVAQVFMGDSDLNLQQIRDGAAWHYEPYAKKRQNNPTFAEYAAAQKQAKQSRKGLWRDENVQVPWDWRKQNSVRQNQDASTKWFGW